MSDLFNKLLILRTPKIGPVKYAELVSKFGTVSAVVESLRPSDELIDSVKREMDAAHSLGIRYICDDDPRYPKLLFKINEHPPVINVRGNTDALNRPCVSMVGTRHASAAGMNFMSDLARSFADNKYTVVSGMAIGTDTAAHRGALRGKSDLATVAILAGGVDMIWPLENEKLYYEILERGCVMSDQPIGLTPNASLFVRRNQGIAAMSEKLILGEADIKSGSMHTARFAIKYKRAVFAIPSHPSDPRSLGPNTLIRDGAAIICTGINDFFKEKDKPKTVAQKPSNPILDALGTNSLSESVLAYVVKKTISEIKADLVVLELQGLVKKQDGGYIKI